jgi:serine/threonine-protein kinase
VQLIDFGQTREGLLFIAMEFLVGRSLRDEIDKVGKLAPQRALRIIMQACGSVGEAHSLGIIHRDIKPDNLYLIEMKGAGDSVKVLDFSVAKMDTGDNQQTRAGVVFGTPAYMSPEQGRGAKLGPQSDIYAFGIVLYEMLSGKPPFDSKIPTEVVMMHLREKPRPLEGFPAPLNALVMRALDKDPTKRQQTCEELANECEEVMAQLFPQMTPQGMRAQTGRHAQVPSAPVEPTAVRPQQGAGGAPPPSAAGYSQAPSPASSQRAASSGPSTVIADAPSVSYSSPPPQGGHGAPPPQRGYGAPAAAAGGAATMMIDAGMQAPRGGGSGTAILDAGNRPSLGVGGAGAGTMILPDSQGVIAFELAKAEAARQAAAVEQAHVEPVKPAHWSFWVGWAVLGLGLGIVMHLVKISQ